MNCDLVFDVLTRGPFPAGDAEDEAVLAHLETCPSCHRLADALRPALELMREAVSVEESRDLPGFWGELAEAPNNTVRDLVFRDPAPAGIAKLPAVVQRRVAPATAWLEQQGAWSLGRFVAASMIVAGVVLVILAGGPYKEDGETKNGPLFSTSLAREFHPAMALLEDRSSPSEQAALIALLRPACYLPPPPAAGAEAETPGESAHPAGGMNRQIACCNDCHRREQTARYQELTVAVAQSCSACHQL